MSVNRNQVVAIFGHNRVIWWFIGIDRSSVLLESVDNITSVFGYCSSILSFRSNSLFLTVYTSSFFRLFILTLIINEDGLLLSKGLE